MGWLAPLLSWFARLWIFPPSGGHDAPGGSSARAAGEPAGDADQDVAGDPAANDDPGGQGTGA